MRLAALWLGLVTLLVLVLGAAACGSSDASSTATDDAGPAADGGADTAKPGDDEDAVDAAAACPRLPKPDDHVRKVVISHPFGADSSKAPLYEVLELSATGTLTKTGNTFTMRPGFAEITFSLDGKIGMVPQDDGSIGVFTFDDAGKPKVIHEGLEGSFYADHILAAKDGQHVYVLDANTESNGGGVHRFVINCDGTLKHEGLVVTGGRAHAMAFYPGDRDRAVLIAYKALDSADGAYAHRLDLSGAKPKRVASGPVFADADAIASWVAITNDGKFALVTDNGIAKGSRMAPVALGDMTKRATISTPSPAAVVMSPFGNSLLLLNSDGTDALTIVKYDAANDTTPFTITGLVPLVGGKTELPSHASVVDRGTLRGRALVAETVQVRQLAFAPDGSITDVGGAVAYDGIPGVVGSLGVEP